MLPYKNCKIYGPYTRPDGRQHIVAYQNGKRITVSYPRYLMEIVIGHYLEKDEEVHHKDGDFTNNALTNLEIKNSSKHRKEHRKYFGEYVTCSWCGKEFWLTPKSQRYRFQNRKRSKFGPFCSRKCVGAYGSYIQMSAQRETSEVESPKFGEALSIGNPEPSPLGKV